jgi:hypothetical protein
MMEATREVEKNQKTMSQAEITQKFKDAADRDYLDFNSTMSEIQAAELEHEA